MPLGGRLDHDSAPTYSVADVHVLLRAFEGLRGSVLHAAPSEAVNSRAHELPDAERALSRVRSQNRRASWVETMARRISDIGFTT